jgi:hypothetical protein
MEIRIRCESRSLHYKRERRKTMADLDHKTLKRLMETRDELKKAFMKNAALRATKVKIEKQLEEIRKKMMEVDEVNKILSRPENKNLPILHERSFLKEIEEEVAEDYKRIKRKSKRKEKEGTKQTRQRMSLGEKHELVQKCIGSTTKPVAVKDLATKLKRAGVGGQATTWLKGAGVPDEALTLAGKGRRDGSLLHPSLVPWLTQAGAVKPAAKKTDDSAKDQKSK